jgi:hypothetical protein
MHQEISMPASSRQQYVYADVSLGASPNAKYLDVDGSTLRIVPNSREMPKISREYLVAWTREPQRSSEFDDRSRKVL